MPRRNQPRANNSHLVPGAAYRYDPPVEYQEPGAAGKQYMYRGKRQVVTNERGREPLYYHQFNRGNGENLFFFAGNNDRNADEMVRYMKPAGGGKKTRRSRRRAGRATRRH